MFRKKGKVKVKIEIVVGESRYKNSFTIWESQAFDLYNDILQSLKNIFNKYGIYKKGEK